jgi:hypothetical protein
MDFGFPQTKEIQDVFGGGVFAAHQMMNNMDIARQYQQQKIAEQEQITRAKDIANQFDMQNNPIRLRSNTADAYGKELSNTGKEFENKGKARTERISSATEGLQLDAAQKKLIQQATEDEVKAMGDIFQRLAYSANPEEAKKGLAGLQLHKDFIKIREQGNEQRKTQKQIKEDQMAIVKYTQQQQTAREEAKAKAKASITKNIDDQLATGKVTPQNAAVALMAEAAKTSDPDIRAILVERANVMANLAQQLRPDPNVGKPEIEGLPTRERAPIQLGGNPGNPRSNQAQPKLPAGAKQIGTSGGKPVYEIDGKKFILE